MFKIYADGEILYSSGYQAEGMQCSTPTCSLEAGKSGAVDFVMMPNHYLYSKIKKLKTRVTVYLDGTLIFNGRVLNWTIDFFNRANVHCEGDLAYLLDSLQPPRVTTMTVDSYFDSIISEHNLQVDSDKQFTKGTVSSSFSSKEVNLKDTSYRDTRATIDNDLIGFYGGFLRTRTVDNTTYLDYLTEYGATTTQALEFGMNILDMTENEDAMELYTVLLPTGDMVKSEVEGEPDLPLTVESVNDGSKFLEKLDGVAKYGRIVHTENFPGATTPETLLGAANDFFNRSYQDPGKTLTVKALDLHLLNLSLNQFLLGQTIHVYSPNHEIDITECIVAIKYDLENVENTEITIGPIEDIAKPGLSKEGSATSLSDALGTKVSGPSGGQLGQAYKHITEGKDWLKLEAKRIDIIAEYILMMAKKDDLFSLIEMTPEGILMYGQNIQMVGAQGFKFTAGATAVPRLDGKGFDTIYGEMYTEIDATNEYIRLSVVKNEDDIAALINLNEEGTLIYGKSVKLIGENGFTFTAGATIEERLDGKGFDTIYEEMYSEIDATNEYINLKVVTKGEDGDDIAALINLSEYGTAIYGKNVALVGQNGFKFTAGATANPRLDNKGFDTIYNEAYSEIDANATAISLRVKADGVITAINIDPGLVTIDASKVNITGIVSATEARIDNIMSGTTTATQLRANHILSLGNINANGKITGQSLESTTSLSIGTEITTPKIYASEYWSGTKNLMTEITAAYTRGSLGVTNAAAAQATANGAQTLAEAVNTKAGTAQTTADTAINNAANAYTRGSLGVTNAAAAQATANGAQTLAEAVNTKAGTAQTTADTAINNAANAYTRGSLGVTNAAAAQAAANTAQSRAETGVSNAYTAQQRADAAYTLAGQSPTGALTGITTINASGKLKCGAIESSANISGYQIWGSTLKSDGSVTLAGKIIGATEVECSSLKLGGYSNVVWQVVTVVTNCSLTVNQSGGTITSINLNKWRSRVDYIGWAPVTGK